MVADLASCETETIGPCIDSSTHLNRLPVQLGPDTEGLRVLDEARADDSRAVGGPAVKALAERPLAAAVLDLPVAVGDVVADGVAHDVVEGVGLRHLGAALADDDDKLALVVQAGALLGDGGHGDGVAVGAQGGDGLVEEDGELGLGHARLLGVEGVVEPQAAQGARVGGRQGREQQADVDDLVSDIVGAEDVAVDDAGLAGLGDVGDARGEDGVAVVGAAALGHEADEALGVVLVVLWRWQMGEGGRDAWRPYRE